MGHLPCASVKSNRSDGLAKLSPIMYPKSDITRGREPPNSGTSSRCCRAAKTKDDGVREYCRRMLELEADGLPLMPGAGVTAKNRGSRSWHFDMQKSPCHNDPQHHHKGKARRHPDPSLSGPKLTSGVEAGGKQDEIQQIPSKFRQLSICRWRAPGRAHPHGPGCGANFHGCRCKTDEGIRGRKGVHRVRREKLVAAPLTGRRSRIFGEAEKGWKTRCAPKK